MPNLVKLACLLAAAALLGGCQKDYTAYALNSSGAIIKFSTRKPSNITGSVNITGLDSGQSVVQITYRPATSTSGGTTGNTTLYCITNDGFLCTVDPEGGTASVIGTVPFTQDLGSGNNVVTLANPVISFDPVVDQLRVITQQYNLRVDPASGKLVNGESVTNGFTKIAFDNNDTNRGKTPLLTGIVYKNPVSGAGSTTLFALDSATGDLLRIGDDGVSTPDSADGGDLRTIGDTGVTFRINGGFSIEQKNGDVFAVLQQTGSGAALFSVDLGSGSTGNLGAIGDNNQTIESLAIQPGD
jgi:hypothetical protein